MAARPLPVPSRCGGHRYGRTERPAGEVRRRTRRRPPRRRDRPRPGARPYRLRVPRPGLAVGGDGPAPVRLRPGLRGLGRPLCRRPGPARGLGPHRRHRRRRRGHVAEEGRHRAAGALGRLRGAGRGLAGRGGRTGRRRRPQPGRDRRRDRRRHPVRGGRRPRRGPPQRGPAAHQRRHRPHARRGPGRGRGARRAGGVRGQRDAGRAQRPPLVRPVGRDRFGAAAEGTPGGRRHVLPPGRCRLRLPQPADAGPDRRTERGTGPRPAPPGGGAADVDGAHAPAERVGDGRRVLGGEPGPPGAVRRRGPPADRAGRHPLRGDQRPPGAAAGAGADRRLGARAAGAPEHTAPGPGCPGGPRGVVRPGLRVRSLPLRAGAAGPGRPRADLPVAAGAALGGLRTPARRPRRLLRPPARAGARRTGHLARHARPRHRRPSLARRPPGARRGRRPRRGRRRTLPGHSLHPHRRPAVRAARPRPAEQHDADRRRPEAGRALARGHGRRRRGRAALTADGCRRLGPSHHGSCVVRSRRPARRPVPGSPAPGAGHGPRSLLRDLRRPRPAVRPRLSQSA